MVTQDLLNYIKQELASGNTKDSIINNLRSIGWNDNDIQEAFNILNDNSVVNNNNNTQLNSNAGLNNAIYNNSNAVNALDQSINTASKLNIQSLLGLIFSVLSLIIYIFNIISSFFVQNSVNQDDPLSSLNNPFLIVLLILGCLVPIFALIGLVLSLLSLKKSKLSIFGLIISILVILIQLISFIYGFFVGFVNGFTSAFNNSNNNSSANQIDATQTTTTTPSPTKTSNPTTKITNTPSISPTPSSYFKTQKEKSDYISKLVEEEKSMVKLPMDYGDGIVLIDIVGTSIGIQYLYEVEDSSINQDYNNGYSNLKKNICNNKDFFDIYFGKDLTVEFVYYFKVDSKKISFTFNKNDCY